MPKKDKKAAKKDKGREPADVVDAVRGAVERTFQATTGGTEGARDRGRSLLDDVASAAQRIRESFDDLRVLEDVRGCAPRSRRCRRRVAELEKQQAGRRPPAPAPRRSRRAAAAQPPREAAPRRRRKPAAAKPPAAKAPAKPSAAQHRGQDHRPEGQAAPPPRRKPAAAARRAPPGGST